MGGWGFQRLGIGGTPADAVELFAEADEDKDGRITFDEFRHIMFALLCG